jgi:hypothetical protein
VLRWRSSVTVLSGRGSIPDRADQCFCESPSLDHGRGACRPTVDHCPLWSELSFFFVGAGRGWSAPLTWVGAGTGGARPSAGVKVGGNGRAVRASDFRTADLPSAPGQRPDRAGRDCGHPAWVRPGLRCLGGRPPAGRARSVPAEQRAAGGRGGPSRHGWGRPYQHDCGSTSRSSMPPSPVVRENRGMGRSTVHAHADGGALDHVG